MVDLTAGLEAFAEQLVAQMRSAGLPQHENAIHHCLALGFQRAYDFKPARSSANGLSATATAISG